MTILSEAPALGSNRPTRGRRWPALVIGVVVLAVAASIGGVAWHRYDVRHGYRPLGEANVGFRGVLTPRTMRITRGVSPGTYIVVGPAGSLAKTRYTLQNNGSHPVRLLGPDLTGLPRVSRVTWLAFDAGGLGPGVDFPVTVAPGDGGFIVVTVTQPNCGKTSYLSGFPIRWSALGVTHTYDFQFSRAGQGPPIEFCPSKSEIAHSVTQAS